MKLDALNRLTNFSRCELSAATTGDPLTTLYTYGVTTSASNINSNDLLASTHFPDQTVTENYKYNALGERTAMTDRNGNVHAYAYDVTGRRVLDGVTTVGTGVDTTVRALGYGYDAAARPQRGR